MQRGAIHRSMIPNVSVCTTNRKHQHVYVLRHTMRNLFEVVSVRFLYTSGSLPSTKQKDMQSKIKFQDDSYSKAGY